MPTLGDYLHDFSSFWTLSRSKATRLPRPQNVATSDPPPAGLYHNWAQWEDEKKARLALYTSWSYSAIHKIGMAALAAALNVKRRVGEDAEEIKNHPLELLIARPNMDISREYLWLHTIYSLYIKRSFWLLYPDNAGTLAEIWPIPFTKMRPIPDDSPNPQGLFKGYMYIFNNGQELLLPVQNVVYLRFPDPLDPYGSLPPTRALMKPVITDNSQQNWNQNLFDQNKGLPSSIVAVDKTLDNNQFETVKRELRENVGRRMVIRADTVDVAFLQETHQEMEFLEGRAFNQKEIFDTLGVPLNLADKEAWRYFINQTVWPVLQMISGQLDTQLTIPLYGDNIFTEFEDIRPQDRSLEVQESVQYSPFRSYNEERATRGELALKKVTIPDHIEGYAGLSLYDDIPSGLVDTLLPIILKSEPAPPPEANGFGGIPSMPGSAGATHQQVEEEMGAAETDQALPDNQEEPTNLKASDGLNGAQISSVIETLQGFRLGTVSEYVAIEILVAVGINRIIAERMVISSRSVEPVISDRSLAPMPEEEPPPDTFKALRQAQDTTLPSHTESWQTICIKRLEEGKSPAYVYGKDGDWPEAAYNLAAALGHCRSKAEVRAVFGHLDEYSNLKARLANRGKDVPKAQLDLEDEFIGPIQEWLADQARRIAQAGAGGELPPAAFWAIEAKLLAAFLTPYVDKWATRGISETIIALAESGLGVDAPVNARVAEWAGKHALELARGLNETTKELARAKIKQWLLTGKPLPELEKSLGEIVAPAWRASLIASTEVTRAFAEVNLEIAQELGVVKTVTWLTAHDELVCPICEPLNGATRPKKPGAVFPGGLSAPPAHPRCRCGLSFGT